MLKINILILFLIYSMIGYSQDYIPVFPSLEGEELYNAVVKDYKTETTLNYSKARDTLFSVIYNDDDSLKCVYTGHTIYLDPKEDPTQAAFMDGSSDGINTEHAFPQSMGAEFGNAKSDMHHLFPTRTAVNSARGNNEYGEIDDNETTQWYYQNNKQTNIPFLDEIDLYSETSTTLFEPREDHKGNIARAMFYFYTMYREEADNANSEFFENQRENLCKWHITDEVDEKEWNRNIHISKYQDLKVNPFIYDCSLATRMYCPTESCLPTSIMEVSDQQIQISPNPASHMATIHLSNNGVGEIYIYDMQGQIIKRNAIDPYDLDYNLDTSDLEVGMYIVKVQQENSTVSELLFVR